MSATYSTFHFTKAITHAIANRDVKAARGLLLLMATHYPDEAEELRDAMLLGRVFRDDCSHGFYLPKWLTAMLSARADVLEGGEG